MAVTEKKMQLVTFQLGEEYYGINIMEVEGIVREDNIRAIPNAPAYVEGIFNLRGTIIPVINLHKRFHLNRAQLSEEDKLLGGLITVKINSKLICVIIDKVSRVMTIDTTAIQPPPQILSGIGAEYIQGVVPQEGSYLIILDINRLFDPKELQQLGRFTQ